MNIFNIEDLLRSEWAGDITVGQARAATKNSEIWPTLIGNASHVDIFMIWKHQETGDVRLVDDEMSLEMWRNARPHDYIASLIITDDLGGVSITEMA